MSTATGVDLASLVGDAEFYTTGELAKLLRVSKMTILRMIHGGELKAARIRPGCKNSPHRVPRAEVLRLLDVAFADHV